MSLWDNESRPWGAVIQPLALRDRQELCLRVIELYFGAPDAWPNGRQSRGPAVIAEYAGAVRRGLNASDVLSVMAACYEAVRDTEDVPDGSVEAERGNETCVRLIAAHRELLTAFEHV